MGIISAIGNNVAENYSSLLEGRTGISHISKIDTVHKGSIMVGEIEFTNGYDRKILLRLLGK